MWIHESMPRMAPRSPEPRSTPPDRRALPEERRRLSGPALRAFFRIAELWDVGQAIPENSPNEFGMF